jgi:putative sterol carrier protein
MPVFQSAEELYEVYKGFFDEVSDTEQARAIMSSYQKSEQHNALVQYIYHNPDAKMAWVANERGSIDVIFGDAEDLNPELTFEMNADIGNKFWLGEVDLTQALARQQMKATGPLSKALKVVPQLKQWYPLYREYLKKIGREELAV